MTPPILSVLLITLAGVILFITEALRVDAVAFLLLLALALSGLVGPEEALSGFAHPATATVAAMFVLSAGLRRTGVVEGLVSVVGRLGGARPRLLLAGFVALALVVSPFVNNTAAVAVLIPVVLGVSAARGFAPGRFLIPLSFSSQMGGVCTLVGTSTNILVAQVAISSGLSGFGMFEFSGLGLCFAIAGSAYLILFSPFLLRTTELPLPVRPAADPPGETRFLADVEVPEDSPFEGKTPVEVPTLAGDDIEIVDPGLRTRSLRAGDRLPVHGTLQAILRVQGDPGLRLRRDLTGDVPAEAEGEPGLRPDPADVILVEAVVPSGSRLDGRTLRETDFQRQHGAVVLAVRHHDRLQMGAVGAVRLSIGDVLLLQAGRADLAGLRRGPDLLLLEEVQRRPFSLRLALAAVGILAATIGLAALGVAPIVLTALAGCGALVLGRILTMEQAYQAIDWKVIFLLAGVLPLGRALEGTGAARLLADGLVEGLGDHGPIVVLSALYLLTAVLTEFMSNNASAALLAPVAIGAAAALGVDPRPFLVAVTFAASTSFLTPVGYQTNAMVYGPGGYRFSDFVRVGAPLNLLFWIMATVLIPRFFPFG